MMNFWKKSAKLPGNLQEYYNYSVIFDGCSTDSSLAPFLIGMDFLIDCCFMDGSFIAFGRDLR